MSEEEDRVVVIGGGLAGMAAAWLLAERGIPVTLIEAGRHLGGKLWSDTRLDPVQSVEHGLHGWWNAYRTFDWWMSRVHQGSDALLRDPGRSAMAVEGRDGQVRFDEYENPPAWWSDWSPLHLGRMASGSSVVTAKHLLGSLKLGLHLFGYRHDRDFADYDRISLEELAKSCRVPAPVETYLLRSFSALLSYCRPHELSAGVAMSALEFYFLSRGAQVLPRWTMKAPHETITRPIIEAIETAGGRVCAGHTVRGLEIEGGRVRAVVTTARTRIPRSAVPCDGFVAHRDVLIGRSQGVLRAFDRRCPHDNGTLDVVDGGQHPTRFVCPRHQARFDVDGGVTDWPGGRSRGVRLTQLRLEEDGGEFVVGDESRLSTEDVVLATDARAAYQILDNSSDVPKDLCNRLASLRAAPLIVVRLWFTEGRPTGLSHEVTLLPQGKVVDAVFDVKRVNPGLPDRAHVVEAHIVDDGRPSSDDELITAVLEDLQRIGPGMTRENLDRARRPTVYRYADQFTLHAPGTGLNRPGPSSSIHGLGFAGDWTDATQNAWFIEQAVISGFRAANAVLARRGLAQLELDPPRRPDSWLRWFLRGLCRALRPPVPPAQQRRQTPQQAKSPSSSPAARR